VNGNTTEHFITPDTKAGIQKLYVLKNGKEIYYIGVTSLSISSRLRIGYRAKGEQGYHGYKWIGKISRAELLVWCFNEGNRSHTEAIEGELVYLVRNRIGKWPTYQMEIHFHPDASEKERQIAETLANICLE
jgi:predicted GIY-YIG superfamily endonuclease